MNLKKARFKLFIVDDDELIIESVRISIQDYNIQWENK